MTVVRRVAKNAVSLFSAQIVYILVSTIIFILIARELGDVNLGKFSTALALTSIFVIFTQLGYDTILIRDVARDKSQAKRYLSNVLVFRALLSLVCYLLIVLTINLLGYPEDTKTVIYLISVYVFLESLAEVFKGIFRAYEKMQYNAMITILVNIMRFSTGLFVLFINRNLIILCLVFIYAAILDFILSFIICEKKFVKIKTEFDMNFYKQTLIPSISIAFLSIFSIVYNKIDIILLSLWKGDAVVGWYNAAYTLVDGFRPIAHLFMSSLFPLMSAYFISSKDFFKYTYEKSFKLLFMLGLPIAVGTFLLADNFILLFYGQKFINSTTPLQIFAWKILLSFLCICTAFVMVSSDRHKQMAIFAGASAVLNIILNLILIPLYSYVGSALASTITTAFLLCAYLIIISRNISRISFPKLVYKPIIAVFIMGFFVFTFNTMNLIALIFIAAAIYFGILYVLKFFSNEDMNIFRSLVKR